VLRSGTIVALVLHFCLLPSAFCQPRIASDFEIQAMEKQLASSRDFLSQLSAHLNLGDLRATRNENALSRAEYAKAYDIAAKQRVEARRASSLSQYATATAYAALAKAKLADAPNAFALLEEATRYAGDDAKTWNLYSTAMSLLGRNAKATSAARNAVAIAEKEPDRLDLNIYRYTLATTLGETSESERLLQQVIADLESPQFASLRREIARKESFEIYSTARGEEAAYLSLLNRARLRLGSSFEKRGETAKARAVYASVLKDRNDEPTALAAVARLSRSESDYAEAFDANPFSLELIRDYQDYLRQARAPVPPLDEDSTGTLMRRAIRGDRAALNSLLKKYPDNDAVRSLQTRAVPSWLPPEGQALLTRDLTPEERRALDSIEITQPVIFDPSPAAAAEGQTIFESGVIGDMKIRFAEPIAFAGAFPANAPLRLTFRILGAANDALLIEPVRLER